MELLRGLFDMAFSEYTVSASAVRTFEIRHILHQTENRNIHQFCHFTAFSTIMETRSCGEVTTRIP